MTWFKVDDSLAFHRKTVAAGNAAMGLWVRAGSWCAQQLTDGLVDAEVARTLGKPSEIKRLVAVGLWKIEGDSYRFHDWFQSNPSRVDVEARRAAEAKKKAEARARRAGQGTLSPRDNPGDTGGTPPVRPGGIPKGVRSTRPDPTRPDPSSSYVGGSVADRDARDPNEPPRCSKHTGLRREDVPDCWACGHKREQWEATRGAGEVFDRPAWCGACDEWTRLVETDDGMARCGTCHPLAVAS